MDPFGSHRSMRVAVRALLAVAVAGAWLVDRWLVRDDDLLLIGVAAIAAAAVAVTWWPRAVLPLSVAAAMTSAGLTVVATGVHRLFFFTEFVGLPVLLATAASDRRWRWTAAPLLAVAGAAISLRTGGRAIALILLASIALLFAGAIAAVRYASLRDEERESSVLAARRDERMAIARDLHDVVGHHVTGMVVLAQAHRFTATDPAATRAFADIEEAGEQAIASIRQLGNLLRAESSLVAHTHVADVEQLAARLATTHPRTALHVDPALAASWPTGSLAVTIYRVLQESVTNVRKHACPDAAVEVTITRTDGQIAVECANDLHADVKVGTGLGLVGIAERVAAAGGSVTAGRDGGRWVVRARLPERSGG